MTNRFFYKNQADKSNLWLKEGRMEGESML